MLKGKGVSKGIGIGHTKVLRNEEIKLTDFKVGLKVPGTLHPKRIKGGIVLERISFEMH